MWLIIPVPIASPKTFTVVRQRSLDVQEQKKDEQGSLLLFILVFSMRVIVAN